MSFRAHVIAHSRNSAGVELVTWELTLARFALSHLLTHRAFSRNTSSSRAIPTSKIIRDVLRNPARPIHLGKNQRGMAAATELSGLRRWLALRLFLAARIPAVIIAWLMLKLGAHKQVVNRLLEPWMWVTIILSTTDRENFFKQRIAAEAQPETRLIAELMRDSVAASVPVNLKPGQWHLPFIQDEDRHLSIEATAPISSLSQRYDAFMRLVKVATGRCARVSYLTHDGRRAWEEDVKLHDRLVAAGEWSPFEHCAMAENDNTYYGNFRGFTQYRKLFVTEAGPADLGGRPRKGWPTL